MLLSNPMLERAVLSALYHNGSNAYHELEDIITDSDVFTIDSNQLIFKCLKKAILDNDSVKIDIATIFSIAKDIGINDILSKKDEINHLKAIIELKVNFDNIRNFAKRLKKLHVTRQIKNELKQVDEKLDNITGEEPISEILSIPEKSVLGFSSLVEDEDDSCKLIGRNTDELIEDLSKNPVKNLGLDVGFPRWQRMIGGLTGSTLNVIASRSNAGKSMLASCFALYLGEKYNIKTLILDTEMEEKMCQYRLLANLSSVPIHDIKTGQFSKNKVSLQRVQQASEKLKKIPYYYKNISNKPSLEEHLSAMRRFIHKDVGLCDDHKTAKPCLIIYDYLKLLSGSSITNNNSEFQILGFMCSELHNFAVKYNVCIVSFVQMNRQGISMSESSDIISQSDRILWLSDSLSAMWDKTPEQMAEGEPNSGNMILTVLKARHGETTKFGDYICMDKTGKYSQIKELKTKLEYVNGVSTGNNNDEKGFKINNDTPPNPNYNALRDHCQNDKEIKDIIH